MHGNSVFCFCHFLKLSFKVVQCGKCFCVLGYLTADWLFILNHFLEDKRPGSSSCSSVHFLYDLGHVPNLLWSSFSPICIMGWCFLASARIAGWLMGCTEVLPWRKESMQDCPVWDNIEFKSRSFFLVNCEALGRLFNHSKINLSPIFRRKLVIVLNP